MRLSAFQYRTPPEAIDTVRTLIHEAMRRKGTVGAIDASAAIPPYAGGSGATDFLEALRAVTVLDRLGPLGAREVPSRVRLIGGGTAAVAYWIGNNQPAPLSRTILIGATLVSKKVGALSVVSNETLAPDAAPEVESLLSRDLVNAAAEALDVAMLDPANAGDDDTPASITNGVTPTTSTGSTLAQIDADIGGALDDLAALGSSLLNTVIIMRPTTAKYLALLRGTGGAPAFPDVGINGGTLGGLPVLTSANVPTTSSGSSIIFVDANDLCYCDDGATVSLSNTATVDMRDDPGQFPASMTTPVSLYTAECTGILSVRRCNWALRNGLIAIIDSVGY